MAIIPSIRQMARPQPDLTVVPLFVQTHKEPFTLSRTRDFAVIEIEKNSDRIQYTSTVAIIIIAKA